MLQKDSKCNTFAHANLQAKQIKLLKNNRANAAMEVAHK